MPKDINTAQISTEEMPYPTFIEKDKELKDFFTDLNKKLSDLTGKNQHKRLLYIKNVCKLRCKIYTKELILNDYLYTMYLTAKKFNLPLDFFTDLMPKKSNIEAAKFDRILELEDQLKQYEAENERLKAEKTKTAEQVKAITEKAETEKTALQNALKNKFEPEPDDSQPVSDKKEEPSPFDENVLQEILSDPILCEALSDQETINLIKAIVSITRHKRIYKELLNKKEKGELELYDKKNKEKAFDVLERVYDGYLPIQRNYLREIDPKLMKALYNQSPKKDLSYILPTVEDVNDQLINLIGCSEISRLSAACDNRSKNK